MPTKLHKHPQDPIKKKRILICASGRGSNLQAVYRALASKEISNGEIVALVCDREGTLAESFAKQHRIECTVISYSDYKEKERLAKHAQQAKTKEAYNQDLLGTIHKYAPDLILSLGYLRIFPETIVNAFKYRMINIHPSLLPAFPGMRAQKQALDYGVRLSGVTVHFIDNGTDTGPIIAQVAVPVEAEDTEESLSQRILVQEHKLIVKVVKLYCDNSLEVVRHNTQ